MANRLPLSGAQWWDATNRQAYAGAKMYTYADQSRTTDKETFDAADEVSSLTNPIIADSNGIFPEIYGNGAYFIDVYSSDDSVLIYQEDSLFPTQPVSSDGSSSITVDTIADLQDVSTTQFKYAFVLGTSAIDDGGQASYYFDAASTATPDGTTIVQPNTGSGRWLILNVETLSLGDQSVTQQKLGWYPLSVVDGLAVTNNSTDSEHDIDIAVGSIANSAQTYVMTLGSALTKAIDATFAVGSGGGRSNNGSTAALAADTFYGVFLISKSTDPTDCDVIFATTQANALADTVAVAAGFDIARLIDVVKTDGSANIINTVDGGNGKRLFKANPVLVTTTASGSAALRATPVPPFMIGNFTYNVRTAESSGSSAVSAGLLTSPFQDDATPTTSVYTVKAEIFATGATAVQNRAQSILDLKVNGSSQIRHRESTLGGTATTIELFCNGWTMDYTITDLV